MLHRDSPSASHLFAHAFHELRRSCDELSAIIDTLGVALLALDQAPASAPPSFFFLKKQALGLAVQGHRCLQVLARLQGREDAALQAVLDARLAEIVRLLPDDMAEPGEAPLVLPLRDAAGQVSGLVAQPAALRLFVRENHLMPRINHILQQTEGASAEERTTLGARIREMIQAAPLPASLAEALSRTERFGLLPATALLPQPLIRAEEGCDLPLPRLAPLRADQLEQGFRAAAARLFAPETLDLLRRHGLCHERLDFSLRCPCAEATPHATAEQAQQAAAYPANPTHPANTPAASALRRLCLLAGAVTNTAAPDAPSTLQTLALRCREAALRACFQPSFRQGEVQLGAGLVAARYCLEHDADEMGTAPLPAVVLGALSNALATNALSPPPEATEATEQKNAVLLGRKYCTVALSSPVLLLEAWSPERSPALRLMLVLSGSAPAQRRYATRTCRDLRDLAHHVGAALASALRQATPFPPTQSG